MEVIKQMKLLVNDKELAKYLISLIDLKEICSQHEVQPIHVQEAINFIIEKRDHKKFDINKFRDKFKEKLYRGNLADVRDWTKEVSQKSKFLRICIDAVKWNKLSTIYCEAHSFISWSIR
jgi:hypothetical protein